MFYVVASTESNYLKLLMIIGNVEKTVTYMEFEKTYIYLWEKGLFSYYMGKSMTVYFAKGSFCFVFCYFLLLSNICRQQSNYEIGRSIFLGPGKLLFMQEYNALKKEI